MKAFHPYFTLLFFIGAIILTFPLYSMQEVRTFNITLNSNGYTFELSPVTSHEKINTICIYSFLTTLKLLLINYDAIMRGNFTEKSHREEYLKNLIRAWKDLGKEEHTRLCLYNTQNRLIRRKTSTSLAVPDINTAYCHFHILEHQTTKGEYYKDLLSYLCAHKYSHALRFALENGLSYIPTSENIKKSWTLKGLKQAERVLRASARIDEEPGCKKVLEEFIIVNRAREKRCVIL